jgi:maleate isomerase
MPDVYGYRLKLGVVTPSVNTVVQYEYDRMRPEGVTNHIARIHVPNIATRDDSALQQSVDEIDSALDAAVERVLSAEVGVVVLGVSIEAIYGNPEAGRLIEQRLRERLAVPDLRLAHAGDAIPAALRAYGIADGPIALLTPYGAQSEPHLSAFVERCGYKMHSVRHLVSPSLVQIAYNPPGVTRPIVEELAGTGAQAIVQFGANLPFGQVASQAETELGLPVIAVNTATYWHALRTSGITDQINGSGRLLSEH